MVGILWSRIVWSLVGLCCLAQVGILLWKLVVEEGSIGLTLFLPLLIGGTIASVRNDQRKGLFEAGRFGPASAICFAVWCMFGLAVLILGSPSASVAAGL